MNVSELWRQSDASGQKFPVDAVTHAAEALPQQPLGAGLEQRSGRSVLVMPDQDLPVVISPRLGSLVHFLNEYERPMPVGAPRQRRETGHDSVSFVHPLIEAVHLAFSDHRPLILSPDAIWLVISQGFAHHLHEHAEELRGRLVRHSGREKLSIVVHDLDATHWPGYVAAFSNLIRNASDPVLHETLLCDFSTTTSAIRTASEVALMEAYERYFESSMICICGIPEITVQGTSDDWRRMRSRIEVLATYDLEWWISRLRPILEEFVRAAEGNPNRDFWKAIYKPEQVYADRAATGWIADLFPYLSGSGEFRRNPVLGHPRTDWTVPVNKGITPGAFPSGLSRVPVAVQYLDGSGRKIELLGGYFGVGQLMDDNALYPMISWAVTGAPAAPGE